jgi:hypothetical protein
LTEKEYTEWDFDIDNYNALSDEAKLKLQEQAKAIFNSDKSPLNFMIKSGGSVGFTKREKHWWEFWK